MNSIEHMSQGEALLHVIAGLMIFAVVWLGGALVFDKFICETEKGRRISRFLFASTFFLSIPPMLHAGWYYERYRVVTWTSLYLVAVFSFFYILIVRGWPYILMLFGLYFLYRVIRGKVMPKKDPLAIKTEDKKDPLGIR